MEKGLKALFFSAFVVDETLIQSKCKNLQKNCSLRPQELNSRQRMHAGGL